MRALVVTNMWPSAAAPQRGIFVADQVEALRRRSDVEVDVFAFPPGPRALLRATATIRRATRGGTGNADTAGAAKADAAGAGKADEAGASDAAVGASDAGAGANGTAAGANDAVVGANDTAAGANDAVVGANDTAAGANDAAVAAYDAGAGLAGGPYDVVHAHFGLAAIPALAARRGPVVVTLHGNDLFVRRSRLATRAALPFTALPAAVSRSFSRNLPGAGTKRRVAVLPVGINLERFRPIPRAEARAHLGLDPAGPYLLFPHDRSRPLKRFDRARELAGDVPLLELGQVAPDEVPYWINAANAVLVPSQDEGFGLSVIEALACGVPAFGTPVGIHPVALGGIEGAYVGEWDLERWRAALAPVLDDPDPRVEGRARAALFSADRMAERVVEAWRAIAAGPARSRGSGAYTRQFGRVGDRAPARP